MNNHEGLKQKENSILYLDNDAHAISSVCYSTTTAPPCAKLREDEKKIQSVRKPILICTTFINVVMQLVKGGHAFCDTRYRARVGVINDYKWLLVIPIEKIHYVWT